MTLMQMLAEQIKDRIPVGKGERSMYVGSNLIEIRYRAEKVVLRISLIAANYKNEIKIEGIREDKHEWQYIGLSECVFVALAKVIEAIFTEQELTLNFRNLD